MPIRKAIFYEPKYTLKSIRVAYLDNQEVELEKFEKTFSKELFKSLKTTDDPDEIIELVINKQVDVLISDFKMPEQDGISLLKYCKRENPKLKLILFTGFSLTPKQLQECSKLSIYKVAKLDTQNLLQTISLAMNEVDSFKGQNFVSKKLEEKPITSLEQENIPSSIDDVKIERESQLITASKEELISAFKILSNELLQDFLKVSDRKNVKVPISATKRITLEELIPELENVTSIGLKYIKEWIEAKTFVKNEISKKNN